MSTDVVRELLLEVLLRHVSRQSRHEQRLVRLLGESVRYHFGVERAVLGDLPLALPREALGLLRGRLRLHLLLRGLNHERGNGVLLQLRHVLRGTHAHARRQQRVSCHPTDLSFAWAVCCLCCVLTSAMPVYAGIFFLTTGGLNSGPGRGANMFMIDTGK